MPPIVPQDPLDATLTQALLHHRAGRLEKAEELYRLILNTQPDHVAAINELGRVLQDQGNLDEAITMFRQVIALQPGKALGYRNLGVVLWRSGKVEESFATLRRHAELAFTSENDTDPPHKVLHDREQREYLKIAENKFHIEGGSRITGHAVNSDASLGDVTAKWWKGHSQIAVIDNFLTDKALDELRLFCLGSTIWGRAYAAGYLGAMPEHGIGCPLLTQIADELRTAYPDILGPHSLRQLWGFKYDSGLGGTAVHADLAAVNVNFWITPDHANRDPESGGLILWDKPAPRDWDFAKYNDNVAAARDYLGHAGARSIKIPYRANRAVIFDSNLFHETDRIVFKEGYLNRRINITMLYGQRL